MKTTHFCFAWSAACVSVCAKAWYEGTISVDHKNKYIIIFYSSYNYNNDYNYHNNTRRHFMLTKEKK